jgi:hypothetical protein
MFSFGLFFSKYAQKHYIWLFLQFENIANLAEKSGGVAGSAGEQSA